MSWVGDATAAYAAGPAALVTVLATEGSAPRGAGTRMVVTASDTFGTIGGGALEWRLVEQARGVLALPEGAWRVQDYPLGPLLGQCCGGRVRVLVERIADVGWMEAVADGVVAELREGSIIRHPSAGWDFPVAERALASRDQCEAEHAPHVQGLPGRQSDSTLLRWGDGVARISARGERPVVDDCFVEPDDIRRTPLMLFGAGHVGRAIADRVPGLPFDLAWFDSRPETDAIGATVQDEDALVACAGEARGDVLILTHDHALDYRLTAAALRSQARFVGLIGSATKRARFVSRLAADGVDPARLTCPIGMAGISGKEPAVIAIAALAQLLAL